MFRSTARSSTQYSNSSPFDHGNGTTQQSLDANQPSTEKERSQHRHLHLPHHVPFVNPHPKVKGIQHEGESGRSGFHPIKFCRIVFRSSCTLSMCVNVLWPVVPAAIAVHFALNDHPVLIFVLNYLAVIPAANLIGFAGQELARKLPKVLGVLIETTLGSVVEMILFIVLTVYASDLGNRKVESGFVVVKAAILGSILANLLLALGLCFIAGGLRHREQVFHDAISEVGSGLMLVAGFALIVPAAFSTVFGNAQQSPLGVLNNGDEENVILKVSRITAILLFVAYMVFVFFQMRSHHGIYDEVFEADEQKDHDRRRDLEKDKLTLTECIVALLIGLTCVALTAVFLILQIDHIIANRNVSEAFMGLILVPLVEKVAEHLTAIDEAWDNQANFALMHVLGACIQTALLNTPLAVFVSWGLYNASGAEVHGRGLGLDLNFRPFEAIVLILAILVVGNFLKDGKSNYLEGALCVFVYMIIAVCAYYYPNEMTGVSE